MCRRGAAGGRANATTFSRGQTINISVMANNPGFPLVVPGVPLATPFNRTVPAISYTFTATEPIGTWTLFFAAFRAGSTELVARGQSFFTATH